MDARGLRGHARGMDRSAAWKSRLDRPRRGGRLSRQGDVPPDPSGRGRARRACRPTIAERSRVSWPSALGTVAVFLMFVAAGFIARHNLRKGRGDRRAPPASPASCLTVAFFVWVLNAKHAADPNIEMSRFFGGLPLWAAGCCGCSTSRSSRISAASGRRRWCRGRGSSRKQWRDPLVGRDILLGVGLGMLVYVARHRQHVARADGSATGRRRRSPRSTTCSARAS